MSIGEVPVDVAGADGCRAGWAVVSQSPGGTPASQVLPDFAAVVDALPADTVIAVDMPIGLPQTAGRGGRGAESLVRRLLGERQSSVFSIPSRRAVYAETGPCEDE